MFNATLPVDPASVLQELKAYIALNCSRDGGPSRPLKPCHRIPFHWPPHPVSADYHVLPSDWTGRASFKEHGQEYPVLVAKTPMGYFGRSERTWNEARGDTLEEMLLLVRLGAEPLFRRQAAIAQTLGVDGLVEDDVRALPPAQLVKLLYCPDRDVANEARIAIETHDQPEAFSPALIHVLRDDAHPHRRSAQWCVLDLFEDLTSFCHTEELQLEAIQAMQALLWTAEDDFARTIYKAGVVLGGHVCTLPAATALLECIESPSRIGRRSAIHAVFHLVEWMPEHKEAALERLRRARQFDPEPALREFASCMVRDISSGAFEHVTEPLFADEP